ncbi:MAG: SMC-Scp complex subunit ScpB [Nitrososphaerota archaeon]|nr:SMC-Scp complex subunit ScpB [Nitrososphaerota archaeon]MDG6939479.1 SMC-Scp complex subunit ScpB [Nitrososphaerota archaeon]
MPDEDFMEGRIEAALYSAGRPLTLDELCRAAQTTSRKKVVSAVTKLIGRVSETFSAVEIVRVGGGSYVMQLKPQFNPMAKKFARQPLLSRSTMKTLTMVAYFQPISAKSLSDKRGSMVYNHLKTLESMGLIAYTQEGKNSLYRTTDYFADYFGLPKDGAQIKHSLKKFFPVPAKPPNA